VHSSPFIGEIIPLVADSLSILSTSRLEGRVTLEAKSLRPGRKGFYDEVIANSVKDRGREFCFKKNWRTVKGEVWHSTLPGIACEEKKVYFRSYKHGRAASFWFRVHSESKISKKETYREDKGGQGDLERPSSGL